MIKKKFLIAVIDGQGGGIGRQYIESLTKALPKDLPVIVRALGTNSAATANMIRGGPRMGLPVKMRLSTTQKKPTSLPALLPSSFPIRFLVNSHRLWPMR